MTKIFFYPLRVIYFQAFRLLLLLILTWSFDNAFAARWYHVEVIIFEHLDDSLSGGEDWSVPDRLPNFATAIDLNDGTDSNSTGFSALPPTSLKLAGIYQRLRGSANYRPVLHKAWRQPGYSANSVRQVHLTSKPVRDTTTQNLDLDSVLPAQWIEGTIGLQGGRLLHVGAKFIYRNNEVTTTIAEFRQVKLKQIHYFDHPLFGVIVQVTPFRAEASPEQ